MERNKSLYSNCQIIILGPQNLQNELLAYVLTKEVGTGCCIEEDVEALTQRFEPEADQRLSALAKVASELNVTLNQVVIAWLRQSDPPVLPIVAASRTDQLAENIAALDVTLSDRQRDQLNTAGNPAVKQAWLR